MTIYIPAEKVKPLKAEDIKEGMRVVSKWGVHGTVQEFDHDGSVLTVKVDEDISAAFGPGELAKIKLKDVGTQLTSKPDSPTAGLHVKKKDSMVNSGTTLMINGNAYTVDTTSPIVRESALLELSI